MFPMRRAVVRRRPLLRAAAVGGGAYLAGRAMANRSNQAQEEAARDERASDLDQPQPARHVPRQAPEPAPARPDLYDQLTQLSSLHERGALTDEEFSAAKARLLG